MLLSPAASRTVNKKPTQRELDVSRARGISVAEEALPVRMSACTASNVEPRKSSTRLPSRFCPSGESATSECRDDPSHLGAAGETRFRSPTPQVEPASEYRKQSTVRGLVNSSSNAGLSQHNELYVCLTLVL